MFRLGLSEFINTYFGFLLTPKLFAMWSELAWFAEIFLQKPFRDNCLANSICNGKGFNHLPLPLFLPYHLCPRQILAEAMLSKPVRAFSQTLLHRSSLLPNICQSITNRATAPLRFLRHTVHITGSPSFPSQKNIRSFHA